MTTVPDYEDRPRISPDEDVVRYVGGSHFDPTTKQINASAFDRLPKDVDGLSFSRKGILASEEEQDKAALRAVMSSRMNLGKTAVFAEINVGQALEALAEFSEHFFFCEDPLEEFGEELANPAHSLLIGLPFKGEEIGSLRAEVAGDRLRVLIKSSYPARANDN